MLSKFLKPRLAAQPATAEIPVGQRVYAIGDIHGRRDLLDALLAKIDADDAARGPAATTLVFLGDLIDRGPESAGVVERLIALAAERPGTRFLLGNHEEVFLTALSGDRAALKLFCRMGGAETIMSYGVAPEDYTHLSYDEMAVRLDAIVPATHIAFLKGFEDVVRFGDYVFVHAGIRPGVALDKQKTSDLRWIREPFLSHRRAFDGIIVHGHTILPEVDHRPNRIGIDTGAYASGTLSALGLEGTDRWILQAVG